MPNAASLGAERLELGTTGAETLELVHGEPVLAADEEHALVAEHVVEQVRQPPQSVVGNAQAEELVRAAAELQLELGVERQDPLPVAHLAR